jgi:hypothetical protein
MAFQERVVDQQMVHMSWCIRAYELFDSICLGVYEGTKCLIPARSASLTDKPHTGGREEPCSFSQST